jgi:hypothetical protein
LQRLEDLHLRRTTIDAAAMVELVHLPSLCKLEPLHLLPCAYPFLPRLLQLRALRLCLRHDDTPAAVTYPTVAERSALCAAVAACRQLTELVVEICMDAELLATFLPSLVESVSALRCLRLDTVAVRSLSFLGAVPLLEELFMHECKPRLSASAVLGIALPRLHTLHLMDAVVLSHAELLTLRSPSVLFPLLRNCMYRGVQ